LIALAVAAAFPPVTAAITGVYDAVADAGRPEAERHSRGDVAPALA
jgi:hypothetical protein